MSLMDRMSKLYLVDQQVRGLRSRLDAAHRYLRAQTSALATVEQREQELLTRKKQHQARMGNLETEGQAIDAQLEKFRDDLNNAATNKQYTAVLSELNTAKEKRAEIDDSILQEMEAIEALGTDIEAIAEEKTSRKKVRDVAQSQLDERENEVGDRLAELEAERAEATSLIPAHDLAVFEGLAETFDGEAMAPLLELDRRRREYACGACNILLPFERVALLMAPDPGLIRCASCTRILFLSEEMRGELTPTQK